MVKKLLFLFLVATTFQVCSSNDPKPSSLYVSTLSWEQQLIRVKPMNDTISSVFIRDYQLFHERWDTLAQPLFWKRIMTMSPDSCVINVAATRKILATMALKDWNSMSDSEKDTYKDILREANSLPSDERIFMTTGKSDFYQFDKVLPDVARGVQLFKQHGIDPWFAQAILMIESPGALRKSNAGAMGAFQLMPGVARSHGLRVDKYVDERKDFDKSAAGAISLIENTCLPYARKILDEHELVYHEHSLWFRLFTLHIYHAGASNVAKVMNAIQPKEGGVGLLQKMWSTSAGNFRNASQNYSQLALAAMLILDEKLLLECEEIEFGVGI
jgi:hypothetical protein